MRARYSNKVRQSVKTCHPTDIVRTRDRRRSEKSGEFAGFFRGRRARAVAAADWPEICLFPPPGPLAGMAGGPIMVEVASGWRAQRPAGPFRPSRTQDAGAGADPSRRPPGLSLGSPHPGDCQGTTNRWMTLISRYGAHVTGYTAGDAGIPDDGAPADRSGSCRSPSDIAIPLSRHHGHVVEVAVRS